MERLPLKASLAERRISRSGELVDPSLIELQAMHEQLEWEILPFRSFLVTSGRHRGFLLGRSGTMLRWRVQGQLGPDGTEMDAEADDDDEDVVIDDERSNSGDEAPVAVQEQGESTIVSSGHPSTGKATDGDLTWEFEMVEPSALGRLFVHIDLQMRQTTTPQPALMFLGAPGGSAEISLERDMFKDDQQKNRYMTIEVWVKPTWSEGEDAEISIPVLYKETAQGKPQYELSVTRSGKAMFRVWKNDESIYSTSVLPGLGSEQPALRRGEWLHLAAVVGRNGLELFIDGDLYAASELARVVMRPEGPICSPMSAAKAADGISGSNEPDSAVSTEKPSTGSTSSARFGPLFVGGDGKKRCFEGFLRQVRLWAMPRSQQQVREWMHHNVASSSRPFSDDATIDGESDFDEHTDNDEEVEPGSSPSSTAKKELVLDPLSPRRKRMSDSDPIHGDITNLIGCWPFEKLDMENKQDITEVLHVQCGSVGHASEAKFKIPNAARWVETHVPLMDYTPDLCLSVAVLSPQNGMVDVLDHRVLEGCEVSFDLGAIEGVRLLVTLHRSSCEQLATVTGVSFHATGRLMRTIRKLKEETAQTNRHKYPVFPLESLSLYWSVFTSKKFGKQLLNIVSGTSTELESGEVAIPSPAKRLEALKLLKDQFLVGNHWLSHNLSPEVLLGFLRSSFIENESSAVGVQIAKIASSILLNVVKRLHSSLAELRATIFDTALHVLPEACDRAQTVEGLMELLDVISHCWPIKCTHAYGMAFTNIMEQLCDIGDRLDSHRCVHHNLLRTYFADYHRPLNEQFVKHRLGRSSLISPLSVSGSSDDTDTTAESKTAGAKGSSAAKTTHAATKDAKVGEIFGSVSVHSKTSNASVNGLSQPLTKGKDGSNGQGTSKVSTSGYTSIGFLSDSGSKSKKKDEKKDGKKGNASTALKVVFENVTYNGKDSIVVLDLGRYCEINTLSAVPIIQNVTPQSAGVLTVEAWKCRPPFAGDRSLIRADGVELELYAFSGTFTYDREGTIGVKSHFPTVVPKNVCLTAGKWYYEVNLVKTGDGVAQIGWADEAFQGSDNEATGTGDDEHSWAYDGHRQKKWNNGCHNWGKRWNDGKVVGCAADIDNRSLSFSLEGSWASPMGRAFTNINITGGLFPALTGERNFKCQVNFGQKPFKFQPPSGHRPVFDWVKENRHIIDSNGLGFPVSAAEAFAGSIPTPLRDMRGVGSSESSRSYPHSTAPLVSASRFATVPKRSATKSGTLLLQCTIRNGQYKLLDGRDTCFTGSFEARYIRVIFSNHKVMDVIPSAEFYQRVPLPQLDAKPRHRSSSASSGSTNVKRIAKLKDGILDLKKLMEEEQSVQGTEEGSMDGEDEHEDDEEEDYECEHDTEENEHFGELGEDEAGFLFPLPSKPKSGSSSKTASNNTLVDKLLQTIVIETDFVANLKRIDMQDDLSKEDIEQALSDSQACIANNRQLEKQQKSKAAKTTHALRRHSLRWARLSRFGSGVVSSSSMSSLSKDTNLGEEVSSLHKLTDTVTSTLYPPKLGHKSAGSSTTESMATTNSTSTRSRSGLSATIELSIEGIVDCVPLIHALPEKLRSSFLVENKPIAETQFVANINKLKADRRNLELALERFSGSIGSTSTGALELFDTSTESWEDALKGITENHPLYVPAREVKVALVDNLLETLESTEVARERLDYIHMVMDLEAELSTDDEKVVRTWNNSDEPSSQLKELTSDKGPTGAVGRPPAAYFDPPTPLVNPNRADSRRISRWFRSVEMLTNLLVRKFPFEGETDTSEASVDSEQLLTKSKPIVAVPLLHKVFSHFCVHHTCSEEQIRITGKLVRRGLRSMSTFHPNASAKFVCDVLRKHFTIPSAFLPPTEAFSEQPVFGLLKAIVEGPNATLAVNEVLSLLKSLVADSNPASLHDHVPLISWALVLVSHALKSESEVGKQLLNKTHDPVAKALHTNCVCAVCGASPIIGARYHSVNMADYDLCEICEGTFRYPDKSHVFLKIPRPLPLPPAADQPNRLPVGPLLPLLRTDGPDKPKRDTSPGPKKSSDVSSQKNLSKTKASKTSGQESDSDGSFSESNNDYTVQNSAELSRVVHTGIGCDGCGMNPIVGVRFKCVNCDEYNLCTRCEMYSEATRGHFAMHVFLKLRRPLPFVKDTNPTALIPNQTLIPILLHPSLFPQLRQAERELDLSGLSEKTLGDGANGAAMTLNPNSSVGSSTSISNVGASASCGKSTSGTIKLNRPHSHILNASGRFGKPLSSSPFASVLASSECSVLDSPPSRRTNGSLFVFDEAQVPSVITRLGEINGIAVGGESIAYNSTTALGVVFTLLSSPVILAPLHLELFLMTAKVLEQLIQRSSAEGITKGVLEHPGFDDFLKKVAGYSQPFIHGSIVRVCEALCARKKSEGARCLLRSNIVNALDTPVAEPAFLLELLLVTLDRDTNVEKEHPHNDKSKTLSIRTTSSINNGMGRDGTDWNRSISAPDGFSNSTVKARDLLDAKSISKVLCLFRSVPLRSTAIARAWAFAFRLLCCYSDPSAMLRGEGKARLDEAMECVIASGSATVALVETEMVKLVKSLLFKSTGNARMVFQQSVLTMLVNAFLVASPVNPRLYRDLVRALTTSFRKDPDPALGLDENSFITLIQAVSAAVATEAHVATETLAKADLDLLREVLLLVSEPLQKTNEHSDKASLLRRSLLYSLTTSRNGMPAPVHSLLDWLANAPPASDSTRIARQRLSEIIVMFLSDVLGREKEAAFPLVDICVTALREPHAGNPKPVAAVIFALIKREVLAHHIVLSRAGAELGICGSEDSTVAGSKTNFAGSARIPHANLLASVSTSICKALGTSLPMLSKDIARASANNNKADGASQSLVKRFTNNGVVPIDIIGLCKIVDVSSANNVGQDKESEDVDKLIAQLLSSDHDEASTKATTGKKFKKSSKSGATSTEKSSQGSSTSVGGRKFVQHTFNADQKERWKITFELPCDATLYGVELSFVSDLQVSNASSKSVLPSRVSIETGNSLSRMSSSGTTTHFTSKTQAERTLAGSEITLSAPVSCRYVRVIVFPPPETEFAASLGVSGGKSSASASTSATSDRPSPGDFVIRGPDWVWGMQDGGLGTKGKFMGFTSWAGIAGKGVRVRWPDGRVNAYRWGYVENGSMKFDLTITPKKEANKSRVVLLNKACIHAVTLQPKQMTLSPGGTNQRSMALFLELCATACGNFSSVQRALAHSASAASLAASLVDYLPSPHTSPYARGIVVLLARHNPPLSFNLLEQMLGPIHSLTPAHAALSAELCTMYDEGTEDRLCALWNFVCTCVEKGEQSPLVLPFLYALAISIEQYTLSDAVLVDGKGGLSFTSTAETSPQVLVNMLFDLTRRSTESSPAEEASLTLLCTLARASSTVRTSTFKNLQGLVDDVIQVTDGAMELLTTGLDQAEFVSDELSESGSVASAVDFGETASGSGVSSKRTNAQANALSALKIFGIVSSCHPELIQLSTSLVERLAQVILPVMDAVHVAETVGIEKMILSLSHSAIGGGAAVAEDVGTPKAGPTSGQLLHMMMISRGITPPLTPSGSSKHHGGADFDSYIAMGMTSRNEATTLAAKSETPPTTPGGSLLGKRRGFSSRISADGGFGLQKRTCENLRSLVLSMLTAVGDSAHSTTQKTWLGESGFLEGLITKLSEFDQSRVQAQARHKALEEELDQKRHANSIKHKYARKKSGSTERPKTPKRATGVDNLNIQTLVSGLAIGSSGTTSGDYESKESVALAAASSAAMARVFESWSKVHDAALGLARTALNLHPANQKRIARLLVSKMAMPNMVDSFVVKLLSELAISTACVSVSVWRPNDVIEELVNGTLLRGISKQALLNTETEQVMFHLNEKSCGSTITISEDGLSGTQTSFEKWGMVRADKELPQTGISTWDVSVDLSPKGHIFVGVATKNSNLNSYLGNDKYGWGYIGNRGAWHNKHKVKTYGKDFRTGYVVTVTMDMDEGVLSFAVNGEDLGPAFDDGLKGKQLYPAFALYQKGDRFTITRCSLASSVPSSSSTSSGITGMPNAHLSFGGSLTSRLRFHRPGPMFTVLGSTTPTEALEFGGILQPKCDDIKSEQVEAYTSSSSMLSPHSTTSTSTHDTWDDNKPVEDELEFLDKEWATFNPSNKIEAVNTLGLTPLADLVEETEIVDIISVPRSRLGQSTPRVELLSKPRLTVLETNETSPVILEIADLGGLDRLVNLARVTVMPGPKPTTPSTRLRIISVRTARGTFERSANEWLAWLDSVEANFKLAGYPRCFVNDKDCVGLLFGLLDVDLSLWSEEARDRIEPSARALGDPEGALIVSLTRLFALSESPADCRKNAAFRGILDRVLLRLGKVQSEEPRRPERTKHFVDDFTTDSVAPAQVAETEEVKTPDDKKTDDNATKGEGNKQLWAPGYGHGSADISLSDRKRETKQKEKLERTLVAIECLTAFLDMSPECIEKIGDDVWNEIWDVLDSSCLLRVFMSFFFGNTIKVVLDNAKLYATMLRLVYAIASYSQLASLLVPVDGVYRSVEQLMQELEDLFEDMSDDDGDEGLEEDEDEDGANKGAETGQEETGVTQGGMVAKLTGILGDNTKACAAAETASESLLVSKRMDLGGKDVYSLSLKELIAATTKLVKAQAAGHRAQLKEKMARDAAESDRQDAEKQGGDAKDDEPSDSKMKLTSEIHTFYENAMRGELFANRDMGDEEGRYSHHYRTQIEDDIKGKVSQTRMRRLNRELKALRKSLPLHYNSTIAVRVDTKRPSVAQCVIFAPDCTPYDSGCFMFDIYFPPEYPSEPPKINLMTTGNGTVRFNPNLYNNGKVCLSLLGTWRGGATGSENWTKNSSLWQVLVSIQSAILGSEYPYFNEPGVESQWGTDQGDLQKRIHSNGGFERLRIATIQYAMVGQLRSPPAGFENVIQEHFRLKRRHILDFCDRWLKEAKDSDTKGHFKSISKQVADLRIELAKLGPSDIDKLYDARDALEEEKGNEETSEDVEEDTEETAEENIVSDVSATPAVKDVKMEIEEGGGEEEGATGAPMYVDKTKQCLASLKEICPNAPIGLLLHALETTKSEDGEMNVAAAYTWVDTDGEQYLNEHMELYKVEV
mmetsp:Transcript_33163/g.53318  ORF Transcript_33163/g.53318 Transcript_33163/m.53318 type:complete len:5108 (-) Transcript_33163:115-15438(-)